MIRLDAVQATLSNWANEFAKWAPPLAVVMYDGAPEERRQIRAERLDAGPSFTVLLTHYDMVIRDKAFLRKVKRLGGPLPLFFLRRLLC